MIFPRRIESTSILLRTPEPEDAQCLYDSITETLEDLRSFPNSWPQYNAPQTFTICQTICNIDYHCDQLFKLPIPYMIFKEEKFCGQLQITRVESYGIEIGFWTSHSQQSQGIMTDALNCFCDWMKETYPTTVVVIGVEPSNKAAIRLAEKSGFTWSISYVNPKRNNVTFEVFHR